MHPKVFKEFDKICRSHAVKGQVLEVGATLDHLTLLNLPALDSVDRKIGINRQVCGRNRDYDVLLGDANTMTQFEDEEFDAVLCNSVLEHDPFFWKTVAEMRRVTRLGGVLVIGAPGYRVLPFERRRLTLIGRLSRLVLGRNGKAIEHSTLTLRVHKFPDDYYRFSPAAFRDVFFEGMADVRIKTVMTPPRVIGCGIRARR